jgi:hypothetical protein
VLKVLAGSDREVWVGVIRIMSVSYTCQDIYRYPLKYRDELVPETTHNAVLASDDSPKLVSETTSDQPEDYCHPRLWRRCLSARWLGRHYAQYAMHGCRLHMWSKLSLILSILIACLCVAGDRSGRWLGPRLVCGVAFGIVGVEGRSIH